MKVAVGLLDSFNSSGSDFFDNWYELREGKRRQYMVLFHLPTLMHNSFID